MFAQLAESEEKNYEHYDRGYGLRKHPRVLLTLPVELTYNDNQQPLILECEAKDISADGIFLKFVASKKDEHSFVGKTVEVGLTRQNPGSEKYSIKGKFAWASKPVENPADGLYYIFCGIHFDEELSQSLQLEQLSINAHKTLEKLVIFYKKNFEKESLDPLQQVADIWTQTKSSIPEFNSIDCAYWYYFAPLDMFVRNSMHMNQDSILYRLKDDSTIREHLMEHRIPISDTELAQRAFYPVSKKENLPKEEQPLSEWLFPLFDDDEFLGLAQFKFKRDVNNILGIDKLFWLFIQISNYVSNVIKSEELKHDNDYTNVLPQIIKLSEPQCKENELNGLYGKILEKFTELLGEIPSFLNLFSENCSANEGDRCVAPELRMCAYSNLKDGDKKYIPVRRMVKNDEVNCCPLSLLEKRYPHFCEANCSFQKDSCMYCIPILNHTPSSAENQNELIAVACFTVPKYFKPSHRLLRRMNDVSRTSSLFIQLCLCLVPDMHINYVLRYENNVY